MPCTYCNVTFSLIKWKNRCQSCMSSFCGNCIIRKQCLACHHVLGTQLQYDRLMKLKIKDLKLFSSVRGLPVRLCKEKHDLAQIILQNCNPGDKSAYTPGNYATQSFDRNAPSMHESTFYGPSKATHSDSSPLGKPTSNCPHLFKESAVTSPTIVQDNVENNGSTTCAQLAESLPRPIPTGIGNKLLITDITSVSQIHGLTSREMKQILVDNFVNYKGCVEKSELCIRVESLYCDRAKNEQRAAGEITELEIGNDDGTCRICWDQPVDCVLLECGHMVTCTACGKKMSECPICRQFVVRCVHVFRT